MWRHNEALEVFVDAAKICCEISNKALNNITNRAIHFVKEGNILKLSCKTMHRSSLLNGCLDWHVTTDFEDHFLFPTEIALTTQYAVIVIWSVTLKKVFIIELTVPFGENLNWAICVSWRNMRICVNNMSEIAG